MSADGSELETVQLSTVEPQAVRWLWEGWLARGRLGLLIGHPGEGKSWCSLALAAALTRGAPMPGHTGGGEPADVLLASAEDDLADTIRPRFDALDGDPARLEAITGVDAPEGERGFVIPRDLELLDAALYRRAFALLVVDPLAAYLPQDLDGNRDGAVRSALAPLHRLGSRHDVAVLAILHLTKGSRESPLLRAQGSVGFTASARTVLALGRDPGAADGSPERHLLCVKSNLAQEPHGLRVTLDGGRFAWVGESQLTKDQLMAPRVSAEDQSALTEAMELLRAELADGPRPAREALRSAAAAGISERTAQRARQALGVVPRKVGLTGGWEWSLPTSAPKAPEGARVRELGAFEELAPSKMPKSVGARAPAREADGFTDWPYTDGHAEPPTDWLPEEALLLGPEPEEVLA